jgi:hypothetical protein
VVGQERRVAVALGAGWVGVVAEPGQLVEQERRPDDHGRLARQVGGPGAGGVLVAPDGRLADQLDVEPEGVDTRLAGQGDGAGVVDQLAVVGYRQVLEGLLGEGVARLGGGHDPRHPVAVEPGGRRPDRLEGGGPGQPGLVEQVLAVDQQLGPAVAGHGHRLAVLLHQAEAPLGKGLAPKGVDDGGGRIGVGDAVGRK